MVLTIHGWSTALFHNCVQQAGIQASNAIQVQSSVDAVPAFSATRKTMATIPAFISVAIPECVVALKDGARKELYKARFVILGISARMDILVLKEYAVDNLYL